LPLFTYTLLMRGHGEKSIGLIYSSNTIGAILGVMFTIFIGMPVLGLKGTIIAGAMLDIAVGVILLLNTAAPRRLGIPVPAAALMVALLVYAIFFHDFNIKRMAAGVFRHGTTEYGADTDVLFHEDGKTASISVVRNRSKDTVLIATNGKPDASIAMDKAYPPTLDTWPGVEKVDTVEIEEAMVNGARYFIPETEKTFDDPRSSIHIADAKTFFSVYKEKYDIIISEPSNPWVSGVSSLFTQEFYASMKQYLNDGGVFAQWIHTYEFSLDLFISVLKSLSAEFPYYSIYFTDYGNIILIASLDAPLMGPQPAIFNSAEMAAQLSRIHINNIHDINFRFIGDQDLYSPYISHYPVPANSDYYPILDLRAPKSRFLRESVQGLLDIRLSPVPILDLLYGTMPHDRGKLTASAYHHATSRYADDAYKIHEIFLTNEFIEGYRDYSNNMTFLKDTASNCDMPQDTRLWVDTLFMVMHKTVVYLSSAQIRDMLDRFTPACGGLLSGVQRDWLDFFEAAGNRDIAALVNRATRLLHDPDYPPGALQKKYLITTLFAAHVRRGEFELAAALWNRDVAGIFAENGILPLDIKLLLALADQHVTVGQTH
jgi:hypothetical protein